MSKSQRLKIISILSLMVGLVFLVSGCNKIPEEYTEREVKDCSECVGELEGCFLSGNSEGNIQICRKYDSYCDIRDILETEHRTYFKKNCECLSEQNESYILSMNVSGGGNFIDFKDKRNLAMIDDKWICYCMEEYELRYYEDIEWDNFGECKRYECPSCEDDYPCCNDYIKNVTEKTEFVWSY